MKITISNKILIQGIPEELKQFLISKLKTTNPKFEEAVKNGRSTYNINPFIYNFRIIDDNTLSIPRGYKKQLFAHPSVKEDKILKILDERTIFKPIEIDSSSIIYRRYQYKAVASLISKSEEGILVAPAGSGKTVMGLSLIPLLGQPTLWLTHTKALANQVLDRAKFFLPSLKDDDIGFIGSGKWAVGKVLTVALVQTLVRKPEEFNEITNKFGLVISDETHHCPSVTFTYVITKINSYYLYGLTATPYRRDGMEKVMFQIMGDTAVSVPTKSVETEGGIIKPKIKYRTITSKNACNGNNTQKLIRDYIIDNKERNCTIVGDVLVEATAGNFCIVMSDRKIHCETLHKLISVGWEKTGIATGDYKEKEVQEQIKRLNNREITVLITTFSLLGEGFDAPFLNRAFITTPFRNRARVEQFIGRIQRTFPGKKDAVVFDYVDVDIGVFKNQFFSRSGDSRYKTYENLGLVVEPY